MPSIHSMAAVDTSEQQPSAFPDCQVCSPSTDQLNCSLPLWPAAADCQQTVAHEAWTGANSAPPMLGEKNQCAGWCSWQPNVSRLLRPAHTVRQAQHATLRDVHRCWWLDVMTACACTAWRLACSPQTLPSPFQIPTCLPSQLNSMSSSRGSPTRARHTCASLWNSCPR